jgi:hypothetical protein
MAVPRAIDVPSRHHGLAAGVDAAPGRGGRRAGGERYDLADFATPRS